MGQQDTEDEVQACCNIQYIQLHEYMTICAHGYENDGTFFFSDAIVQMNSGRGSERDQNDPCTWMYNQHFKDIDNRNVDEINQNK